MSKLYVFACSYGKHGTVVDNKWIDTNSFGDKLAQKFNMELDNYSVVGACNYTILKKILGVVKLIRPDDMVIIQWTYTHRAWTRYNNTVMPSITDEVYESYYKNFYNEWQNLYTMVGFNCYVKSLLKCKYYFSIVDDLNAIEKLAKNVYHDLLDDKSFVRISDGKKYVTPLEFVRKRPEFVYSCHHPNIKGHDMIANFYHEYILNN